MPKYDKTNPKSIEFYAQQLIGHTFGEVASWNMPAEFREEIAVYEDKARKGGLGNLIEEQFFGYKANSDDRADFHEAGVELKVTPFEKTQKGALRAGERLVLTMISYEKAIEPSLYQSHLWEKCKLLLLIYYLRDKALPSNMDYQIHFAQLFTPPEEDLRIIEADYKVIADKVASGRAHELSESDTMYLGACTKGATAEKSTVPQAYYAPDIKARKRAFCYKNSYMTYVLNTYIAPKAEEYEKLITDTSELKEKTFEEIIIDRINKYVGRTDKELCELFDREYNNNKAQWIDLAYRMLGIKSSKAEEFAKAQIVVKAIRIEESGKMRESSPLPVLNFKELVSQEWEDSELFSYFDETKFLFVVYRKEGDTYILKGAQLWNMPYDDLNTTVHRGWSDIKEIVEKGVEFTKVEQKGGAIIMNNLPSKDNNPIIHIRPHAAKSYYVFEDGSTYGSGRINDSDELPDGRRMTSQSFWLNNDYIISQLNDNLKK